MILDFSQIDKQLYTLQQNCILFSKILVLILHFYPGTSISFRYEDLFLPLIVHYISSINFLELK